MPIKCGKSGKLSNTDLLFSRYCMWLLFHNQNVVYSSFHKIKKAESTAYFHIRLWQPFLCQHRYLWRLYLIWFWIIVLSFIIILNQFLPEANLFEQLILYPCLIYFAYFSYFLMMRRFLKDIPNTLFALSRSIISVEPMT